MKWLGIGFALLIAASYIAVCFGAASYDEKGNRISGWLRWLKFLAWLPWLISNL